MRLRRRERGYSVVVLTGASSGVGRATARRLAEPGVSIALLARGADGLEGARAEVEAAGARALVLQVDVADAEAVEHAAERVERELGPIDVWINAAMAAVLAPFLETTPSDFRRVVDVTFMGYVHGTTSALRRMQPRNRGTIVQVGSALAYRGIPLQSSYCAAKHAIKGFTEAVRCELLHEGSDVHVGMVHLPGLNTPQFDQVRTTLPRQPRPVAPVYQPEVAAEAIAYAIRRRPRQVLVGRPTIGTIVGNAVMPGLLDRYLARTAYSGQMTDEPLPERRRDYLWEPVPGDRGAHGRFGDEAAATSVSLWAVRHRRAVLAAAVAGTASAAAVLRRR